MKSDPIFIIGNPRSGTSLFRLMLTNHKDIIIPPECGFITWWFNKYKKWNIECNNDQQAGRFIDDLFTSRKFETWGLRKEQVKRIILKYQPNSYAELVKTIYSSFAIARNKTPPFWGDKNNYYIREVDKLIHIFPEAFFILLIRDGRDVASSYRALNKRKIYSLYAPKLPDNIEAIAQEWLNNNQSAIKALGNVKPDKKLFIRYEDLVNEPEVILTSTSSFLNLEYDPSMLKYYVKNKLNELEPREFLQWKYNTLKAPLLTQIGRYKHELKENEIIAFNKVAGEMLKKFSYSLL